MSNPTGGDAVPGGVSFVGVSQAAFEGGALGTVRYSVTVPDGGASLGLMLLGLGGLLAFKRRAR